MTTKSRNQINVMDDILQHLETVTPGQPVQFPDAASIGDTIRQGDLYLTVVEKPPPGYKKAKAVQKTVQLVPGNTQGAKHCLDSLHGVEMFLPQEGNEESLDGPCLVLTEGRKVLHPTHGEVSIPAGFTILCSYQREYDKELAKERRARD